jgi:hypothetical protein
MITVSAAIGAPAGAAARPESLLVKGVSGGCGRIK